MRNIVVHCSHLQLDMNELHRFAIIVPVFNRKDYVAGTVKSVLEQSYANFELLLVDDGSEKETLDYLDEVEKTDRRIRVLKRTEGKKGAPSCRNLGAKKANSDYLIFLDSDDLLADFCLEERSKTIDHNSELQLLVFPALHFREVPGDTDKLQNIITAENELDRFLQKDMIWLTTSPTWQREAFLKLGGFDEDLLGFQDMEINIRALASDLPYRFFTGVPDNYYRLDSASSISQTRFQQKHFLSQETMLVNIVDLLLKKGKLTDQRRLLCARLFLQLAIRWRFHQGKNKKEAKKNGRRVWRWAQKKNLLSNWHFFLGLQYVLFKSELRFNRLPFLQQFLEKLFTRNLVPQLIFHPSKTQGKISYKEEKSKVEESSLS